MLTSQEAVCVDPDDRLDAADAGSDRAFAEELDEADLTGALGVRAAAELTGPVPDRDHAHPVAVLLAEERHRAGRTGRILGHVLGVDGEILGQHVVDASLDVGQHGGRHGRGEREVEAEPSGRVLRAHLGRGVPQRLTERLVHQVRCRVRPRDRAPALEVDAADDEVADSDLPGGDATPVDVEPRNRLLYVVDHQPAAVGQGDGARIGELTTALGVERGPVENDLDRVALASRCDVDAVHEQTAQCCFGHDLVVAGERRDPARVHDVSVDRGADVTRLALARIGLGPVALLGHQPAEAVLVDLDALLGGHLERQVDREAERVVQREGLVAGERAPAGPLQVDDGGVEDRRAGAQGLREQTLLRRRDARQPACVDDQLGVLRAHRRDGRSDQLRHDGVTGTEQAHVAHNPTQDAS